MTKYDRAVDLTEEELADMTTPTLGAVAQALGTSGKFGPSVGTAFNLRDITE